jgi:hypothetical protein
VISRRLASTRPRRPAPRLRPGIPRTLSSVPWQPRYMAAVAPPPTKSTFGPWASSSSAVYPTVPPTEPMTDIMSYQYPPPPPNGADMDMPPSGYLPSYSVAAHASSGMDPDSTIPSRERSDLKRSISTPVVGPSQSQGQPQQPPTPQQSAAGQDPAAERRRNKLGYHRTSVACGKWPSGIGSWISRGC